MGILPSGTVTLLFSDIEGSTALLGRLGPAYADALGAHRRMLRSAWACHNGRELGTEGDSFFVAFDSAHSAVSAAVHGQRELADFSWPNGESLRVRMGLHSGTPTEYDGGYVGMDVHRCARVASAAHGGQIVISDTTAHLLGGGPDLNFTLRDLGSHQLKDLPELERLYQVEADGLRAQFPPLRSLGAVTRLPRPATQLVGRRAELAELATALRAGERLLTLTGAGGSGKTRLAIELARRAVDNFPDGVYFTPLADVFTADQMWDAIAYTLGTQPGASSVVSRIGPLGALLVLDNLEQLAGADAVVSDFLRATGSVVLLATSRRPLHVLGEHEYPVSPLDVPIGDTLAAGQASPAVQLFVQQVRQARPGFHLTQDNVADVGAVCRALDGLPLAIEIAGARGKVLSPRALLARLTTGQDMSTPALDVADRHRTVRSAIAWSYDLLQPELQTAFACLGIFDGGADLRAVSAVLDDGEGPTGTDTHDLDPLEVVTALNDVSLASVAENYDGEPRVQLLETIRSFATERLAAAGMRDPVCARHAMHYVGLVEEVAKRDAETWRAREVLDTELGNLRAALRWCLEAGETDDRSDRAMLALRLCAGLREYWDDGAMYVEARGWLEPVVALGGPARNSQLGQCLWLLAKSDYVLGNLGAARGHAKQAIEVFRELGEPGWLSVAYAPLAFATWWSGDPDGARLYFEEALEVAREADPLYQASTLTTVATFENAAGNGQRALDLLDEAVELAHAARDILSERWYDLNRAVPLCDLGRLDESSQVYLRHLPAILREPIPVDVLRVAEGYAQVLAQLGRRQEAVQLLGAADAMRDRCGYPRNPWDEERMRDVHTATRQALSPPAWDASYASGQESGVHVVLSSHVA